MEDLERILISATEVFEDRQTATDWLSEPLAVFDGRTPKELILDGRIDDVIRYLRSISSGFIG